MTDVVDELVGVSAARAAELTDISRRRLLVWANIGLVDPAVRRRVGGREVRLYGFEQLVELRMVRALEDAGRPTQQIHWVVDAYRSFSPYPLRELTWAVSGREIFVQFPDGHWHGGNQPGQGVMHQVLDLERIRTHLRRDLSRPRRHERGNIEKRRGTLGSKPVFEGTRTPVAAVQSYLKRDIPEKEILEAFPHLSSEDIEAARRARVG